MEHRIIAQSRVHLSKSWFFVVFVGGAATIILLDLLELPKSWSIISSAALIVIYAFCAFRVPGLRARADQVADNSYYLGLLFTLVSLALALYRFANTDLATDAILRNFGIAISSTIVGLALRVLLSQLRDDPDDIEYEARTALAETVRRLRAELDQSVAEMQRFVDGTRQALQETTVEATRSTAAVISKALKRFETSTDGLATKLDNATGLFEARAKACETAFAGMSGAVVNFQERVASVRVDPALVESAVRPQLAALEGRVGGLAAEVDVEGARLAASLAALAALTGAVEAFGRSAGSLDETSERIGRSAQSVEALEARFAELEGTVRGASESASRFSGTIQDAAAAELKQSSEAVNAMRGAAEAVAAATGKRLRQVDEAAAAALQTLARLNSEFATSGETVQTVRRELAELAAWIIERIEQK